MCGSTSARRERKGERLRADTNGARARATKRDKAGSQHLGLDAPPPTRPRREEGATRGALQGSERRRRRRVCVGRASEASERSERSERNEREAMGWRQMPRARRARQKARGLGLAADAASPTREAKSAWTRAGGRCREPDARGKKRVDSGWRQLPRARRGRQKAGGYGLAAAAASPTREAKSGLTRAGGSCREPDAGGKCL